jgi:ribosomal protein S8
LNYFVDDKESIKDAGTINKDSKGKYEQIKPTQLLQNNEQSIAEIVTKNLETNIGKEKFEQMDFKAQRQILNTTINNSLTQLQNTSRIGKDELGIKVGKIEAMVLNDKGFTDKFAGVSNEHSTRWQKTKNDLNLTNKRENNPEITKQPQRKTQETPNIQEENVRKIDVTNSERGKKFMANFRSHTATQVQQTNDPRKEVGGENKVANKDLSIG